MCLAIPGRIVEILTERENLALVEVVGVRRKIDVGLLEDDPAKPGDWVLIHVGFAMSQHQRGRRDGADADARDVGGKRGGHAGDRGIWRVGKPCACGVRYEICG